MSLTLARLLLILAGLVWTALDLRQLGALGTQEFASRGHVEEQVPHRHRRVWRHAH